ncbi:MAG: 30S ribosomal protein S20 [Polyangiaceae bacterium]|nr:30S ribosomal protein S20 [Polyangiaceae bacterium]
MAGAKAKKTARHPSAIKRNRQRIKRTIRNRAASSEVRTFVRKAREAIEADPKTALAIVRDAISALDKAATKGVVHPKAASRTASRLSAQLAKTSKK